MGFVADIASTLQAAGRAGLKDLQSVVLSPVEGSMQTVSEPGMPGVLTSQLVTEQIRPEPAPEPPGMDI